MNSSVWVGRKEKVYSHFFLFLLRHIKERKRDAYCFNIRRLPGKQSVEFSQKGHVLHVSLSVKFSVNLQLILFLTFCFFFCSITNVRRGFGTFKIQQMGYCVAIIEKFETKISITFSWSRFSCIQFIKIRIKFSIFVTKA